VHLARLGAYYHNCRDCAHRHDTGQLPKRIVARLDRMARQEVRESLLTPEGIRGVYLNELARPQAERYAAAFASLIWEQFPLDAPLESGKGESPDGQIAPSIILGRDARASSPDIALGVAAALRRMGCRVVDIDVVHAACLWFAVQHLGAAGGVYVSGHGSGPATTGLDFVDGGAVPWSQGGSLERVETLARGAIVRPTRRGGKFSTFRADVPYAAGMLKHLQSLRALQIGIACEAPLLPALIAGLFADVSCRLHWAVRESNGNGQLQSPITTRLADAVREEQLQLGIHIAEDGQACTVLDERGRVIPPAVLAAAFAKRLSAPGEKIVVDKALADGEPWRGASHAERMLPVAGTRESITRAFVDSSASLGVDRAGRFWFPDQHVTCDAVLTLARLLRVLCNNDRPLSALRDC
jgi:phosphomannomutase